MKILILGDIHEKISRLQQVLQQAIPAEQPDAILLVGDLAEGMSKWTYQRDMDLIFALLDQTKIPYLWVPGNHDLPYYYHKCNVDGKVLPLLKRDPGNGMIALEEVWVGGIGGSVGQLGWPYEWTAAEDETKDRLPEHCDILLTHCPPYGTKLDLTIASQQHPYGEHIGSKAIRGVLERNTLVHVCGHCHEAGGQTEVIGTSLSYNAGAIGGFASKIQYGLLTFSKAEKTIKHITQ